MAKKLLNKKSGFGTLPVFMTTLTTILGAVLFLRFGYAVGNVGFYGTLGIILLGHLITIPTALAVAEIATNRKVQGGGAYYIISRSFGLNIGGAIGIALYLSQAISVAFYVIAFSEAFDPVLNWLSTNYDLPVFDKRIISIPMMGLLALLILTKGANVGMKALYGVAGLLFVSIILFFTGKPLIYSSEVSLVAKIANPDSFFYVFTIVFPAFTGLVAGLGLSGELRDPKTSIPKGTLWATIIGMIVYIFAAYKLATSASPEMLGSDMLIMQRIASWGPIIPAGLAAATLSSALGSIMVAPRTLQAIGADNIIPNKSINTWLSKNKKGTSEPNHAAIVTIVVAFLFVAVGDVDFVARVISMFFMVTYAAICLISLMEHFSADPSYRPTFKSRWYFSLTGFVMSVWAMFKMDSLYATLSIGLMVVFYLMINADRNGMIRLFRGVVFQLSRNLQIIAQRADKSDYKEEWRPFAMCISTDSFKRSSAFDTLRWISYKHGFGTYIHYLKGMLNDDTNKESKLVLEKLINLAKGSKNRIYLDTIISPSYISAIAQVIQLSGVSGKGNNMLLFEFSDNDPSTLEEPLKTLPIIKSAEFDLCILNTSYKGFGYKKEIHLWIAPRDLENANLMILLAYIILGHPEWKKGIIKIFATYAEENFEQKKADLLELIKDGRLPISPDNVFMVPKGPEDSSKEVISEKSIDADLVIVGFRTEAAEEHQTKIFTGYKDLSNILFVSSAKEKEIIKFEKEDDLKADDSSKEDESTK